MCKASVPIDNELENSNQKFGRKEDKVAHVADGLKVCPCSFGFCLDSGCEFTENVGKRLEMLHGLSSS